VRTLSVRRTICNDDKGVNGTEELAVLLEQTAAELRLPAPGPRNWIDQFPGTARRCPCSRGR